MGGKLSKSKYTAFWQCPKILWMKTHMPDMEVIDPAMQSRFESENEVGDLAQWPGKQKNVFLAELRIYARFLSHGMEITAQLIYCTNRAMVMLYMRSRGLLSKSLKDAYTIYFCQGSIPYGENPTFEKRQVDISRIIVCCLYMNLVLLHRI